MMSRTAPFRFGLGRFNNQAPRWTMSATKSSMFVSETAPSSLPLYEMVKEGIDLTKIEWAAH